MKALTPGIL